MRLPLLVEAAETEFVPVAIRNNVKGYEADILERYEEPAWNNPVVRFLDADGEDVIPRKDRVWQTGPLLARMTRALRAADREVPAWLDTVAAETASGEVETAVFAMSWYWVGEARFGSLPGVVSTQAGWIGGLEVVEVDFRPQELQFPALLAHAIEHSCDQRVFATTDAQLTQARARVGERAVRLTDEVRTAKASDQLYYLGRSHLRFVPLTPVQARRVNGALGTRGDPGAFLSPRQLELARRIRDALGHDPKALDGLERPSELTELDEYQTELSDRLAVTDAESP